jgi:hypothetical protein
MIDRERIQETLRQASHWLVEGTEELRRMETLGLRFSESWFELRDEIDTTQNQIEYLGHILYLHDLQAERVEVNCADNGREIRR